MVKFDSAHNQLMAPPSCSVNILNIQIEHNFKKSCLWWQNCQKLLNGCRAEGTIDYPKSYSPFKRDICRKSTRNTKRLQWFLRHVQLVEKIQCHCLEWRYPEMDVTFVLNRSNKPISWSLWPSNYDLMMSRTTTMPILSQIIFMQCRVQQLVHPIPNYSIAMPCTVIRSIRSKITVMQCRAQLYGISDQKLQ